MAFCATAPEWASESAFGPGPLLPLAPAILRWAVRDFPPPAAMCSRAQNPTTPYFKGVRRTTLKITTGLVASRPLGRRLRRWCRCFFPLCHFQYLKGRSGMSRHLMRIIFPLDGDLGEIAENCDQVLQFAVVPEHASSG